MTHWAQKVLVRAFAAIILCGGIVASGLVAHVTTADQVMFACIFVPLTTLLVFGIESVCERANYRFSVRGLFIVTTLVAITLSVIGYMARK
jgi:hypothetical protein